MSSATSNVRAQPGSGVLRRPLLSQRSCTTRSVVRRFESEFVSEAGAILVSSPDYREALARLAARAVPRLADWCVFHLQIEDGTIERTAVAFADGLDPQAIERFVRSRDGEPETAFSVDRVVRTGRPALVPGWTSDDGQGCAAARMSAARELDLQSVLAVPLVAHSRTLGALTVGTRQHGAVFGSSELRFAQDLAHRVALSIDNIVSYEEARRGESAEGRIPGKPFSRAANAPERHRRIRADAAEARRSARGQRRCARSRSSTRMRRR